MIRIRLILSLVAVVTVVATTVPVAAPAWAQGAPVSEASRSPRPAADAVRAPVDAPRASVPGPAAVTSPVKGAEAARPADTPRPAEAAKPADSARPAKSADAPRPAADGVKPTAAKQQVKSITPEELDGFLYGKGMDQARAAELNRYPSPEYVLELADKLGLSRQQRERTQQVLDESQAQAARLGYMLVDKEKELDRMFSTGLVTREKLFSLLHEIAHMRADIRGQHLEAHMAQRMILTPPQLERYMQLRGHAPMPIAAAPRGDVQN